MKILYFDCFSGISGDMAVGAMLDLGISPAAFKKELNLLGVKGLKVNIKKIKKNSMTGTDFSVIAHEKHHHGHGRNLKDIEIIINKSKIAAPAKALAIRIFSEIGRAEAKVHGTSVKNIHFHEVGALDPIADICGAAICMGLLGAEKIYSSELHDGRGTVKCAHGLLPVPVPAVVEMLAGSGIPMIQEDIKTELVTPTGMGIIKCASSGFGPMPAMKVLKTGYGFGKRDTGGMNALRVMLGEGAGCAEKIVVLETNIDNMVPEALGFAMEMLFEAGAYDVYFTPIYMKKNRPAVMLTALTPLENENAVMKAMFKHTSTLGMRRKVTERYCMDREIKTVRTKYGPIRVKCASTGGIVKQAPEYEDCRKAAIKTGRPINEIYETAMAALKKRG